MLSVAALRCLLNGARGLSRYGLLRTTSLDVPNSDLTVIEQLQQEFRQDGLGALRTLVGDFNSPGLYNPPKLLGVDEH